MKQTYLKDLVKFEELLKQKDIKHIFLVIGLSFKYSGRYQNIIQLTDTMGIRVTEYTGIEPNPSMETLEKCVHAFNGCNADFIIGAGGGSVLDVTKCLKIYGESYSEMLAIPTTAGTGSESTRFAVIYKQGEKISIADDRILPEYIMFAPETIITLPDYQKKVTMLDALCHGIESMWAINANVESEKYAELAIKDIFLYMSEYFAGNTDVIEKIIIAANNAGKAINISATTAAHAMSYKMTSMFGIAHGHAVMLCIPKLWRYMTEHMEQCIDKRGTTYVQEQFVKIANFMGADSVTDAIHRLEIMITELGLKIPKIENRRILNILVDAVNVERLNNNPITLSKEDLYILYEKIFDI